MRKNQPLINSDDDIITKIGTILSINKTTKLAVVELEDETILTSVGFFYHCMPDDVEGGYQAFAIDDKVLVAEKKYIIGFADLKPRSCERVYPIQLLTFDGTVENINSRAFSVIVDEGCDFELEELTRKLSDPCIQHLSQCRYKYGSDETQKIVSIMHYDSYSLGEFCAVIRIINHEGSADFVLKEFFSTSTMTADKVHFYGSLSADLETLYTSFYADNWGIIPPTQRYLSYNKYKLVDVGDIKEWHLEKQGISPIGLSFIDNTLDREGRCGCWRYEDGDTYETFTKSGSIIKVDCKDTQDGGWKSGTRAAAKYKTFNINTELLIESEKIKGLHLSPIAKDFVTCKGKSDTDFFYKREDGQPNIFIECQYFCECTPCSPPHYWIINYHYHKVWYSLWNGGWSRDYLLFNGWETLETPWGAFFYNRDLCRILDENKTCGCPAQQPFPHICFGNYYELDGGEMRALSCPYTSAIFAGHVKIGTEIIQTGYAESMGGYLSGVICGCFGPGPCGDEYMPHRVPCGYIETDIEEAVNSDNMEILSPIEMILEQGDVMGNTFISYDEETDSLLRGMHYKKAGESWQWEIWAKFPGCADKDITTKLASLLSSEHFFNIEAIIFT